MLLFKNETNGEEFELDIRLTEEEWKEACFCVELFGQGDSVKIL